MATSILWRVEQGQLRVQISDIVVFETVFTLQRSHRQGREAIASAVLPLIELPGIVLPGKRRYRRIFELYRAGRLGFADCFHVVLMKQAGITEVLSFDSDFDGLDTIVRRQA